jgi:hypothetical protein
MMAVAARRRHDSRRDGGATFYGTFANGGRFDSDRVVFPTRFMGAHLDWMFGIVIAFFFFSNAASEPRGREPHAG